MINAVWFSHDGRTITALDLDQRGDIAGQGPGLTTWETTKWQVISSLTLSGGNNVQLPYPGSSGNLVMLHDQLGLLDDSTQNIKFWKLPILPAQH